jgi:hypothetical protein
MYPVLTRIIFAGLLIFVVSSCQKELDLVEVQQPTPPPATNDGWIDYNIAKGEQYCDKNTYKPVSLTEMKFMVKFDSSAVYQTVDPDNQGDINKLYGFSDNNQDHHTNSARIG